LLGPELVLRVDRAPIVQSEEVRNLRVSNVRGRRA